MPGNIRRLASRKLPPEIRQKTRTFAGPVLRHTLRTRLNGKDASGRFRQHISWSTDLGNAMVRAGFGQATHLYSMLGECGPFLKEGKRLGLQVISEVYISLSTERILAEERTRFPDWEPSTPDFAAIRCEREAEDLLLTQSDFFICPSTAVQEDLVANWGVPPNRTSVVPYGTNPGWLALEPRPVTGRVLFVGTAELRKGIHYLAMAANKLRRRGAAYEFHVAGDVTPEIARRSECAIFSFLGRIPRNRIHEEFQKADVFVLPSLAEGSAGVIYEALAAGVPVITTHAAGSVVCDGVEGRIVRERDADALADAIQQLVEEDRAMRERMAVAARERAREYTWERYGERLLTTLRAFGNEVVEFPETK